MALSALGYAVAAFSAWLGGHLSFARGVGVNQTAFECERVIFGYVAGNIATSVFATIYVVVVLSVLKVPAAFLLALIAGVGDFVPVLGFIVSVIPAVVLAFTVSRANFASSIVFAIGFSQ